MTKRKFNKILKLLNKAYELLRSEQQNYKKDEYANVKVKVKRVIDSLYIYEYYWSEVE